MIRRALVHDIPAIEEMISEMLAASKYAGRMKLRAKDMRQMLMSLWQSQNRPGIGGSYLRVAERDGKIVGFMAGILQAVYFVGDKLAAEDVYLYVRPKGGATTASRLVDDYSAWAHANPKVIEVKLSWTDALPGASRIGDLYERKGFSRSGAIYDRAPDVAQEIAA